MKAMQKIRRGRGFRGVLNYVLERGYVIGGNMAGSDSRILSKEFSQFRTLLPEIDKPVWHNSLRLPASERISNDRWVVIADEYMTRLGFSNMHPRAYVLHDDPDGQHIHIVACRISAKHELYLGQNENLKSTKIVLALEIENELNITRGPKIDRDTGKIVQNPNKTLSKNETEMSARMGSVAPREKLQQIIANIISKKPTTGEFMERLEQYGVSVRPNIASTGKLNGFSFEIAGIAFKGSQLGADYKWASIKQNIDYDELRDYEALKKVKNENSIRTDARNQPPNGGDEKKNERSGAAGAGTIEHIRPDEQISRGKQEYLDRLREEIEQPGETNPGTRFMELSVECSKRYKDAAKLVGDCSEQPNSRAEQPEREDHAIASGGGGMEKGAEPDAQPKEWSDIAQRCSDIAAGWAKLAEGPAGFNGDCRIRFGELSEQSTDWTQHASKCAIEFGRFNDNLGIATQRGVVSKELIGESPESGPGKGGFFELVKELIGRVNAAIESARQWLIPVRCFDPSDTSGKLMVHFAPAGPLTRALKRILSPSVQPSAPQVRRPSDDLSDQVMFNRLNDIFWALDQNASYEDGQKLRDKIAAEFKKLKTAKVAENYDFLIQIITALIAQNHFEDREFKKIYAARAQERLAGKLPDDPVDGGAGGGSPGGAIGGAQPKQKKEGPSREM